MASSVYYYNNNSHKFNEAILVLFRACTPRIDENIIFGGRSVFNGLLVLYLSSDAGGKRVYDMLRTCPPPCSSIKSVTVLFYKTDLTGQLSPNFINNMKKMKKMNNFIFVDVPHTSYGVVPDSAYLDINNFISLSTENVINNSITPQSFSYNSKVMLRTTTIFSDTWIHHFDEGNTKPYRFHTGPNSIIVLQMMMTNNIVEIPKISLTNATVFKIPYDNGVSMIVYMPDNPAKYEQLHDDISALSKDNRFGKLQQQLQNCSKHHDILRMPKFNYQTTTNITRGINAVKPFSLFNMSEMFQDTRLAPSELSHEIYNRIDNNEIGTTTYSEYTAFGYDSPSSGTTGLTINKPFGFFIVQDSGHIINLGIFTGIGFEISSINTPSH